MVFPYVPSFKSSQVNYGTKFLQSKMEQEKDQLLFQILKKTNTSTSTFAVLDFALEQVFIYFFSFVLLTFHCNRILLWKLLFLRNFLNVSSQERMAFQYTIHFWGDFVPTQHFSRINGFLFMFTWIWDVQWTFVWKAPNNGTVLSWKTLKK